MITFRVPFLERAVTAVNYFILMRRVYEPRVGELRAHQIGTRIVYIFAFAYLILSFAPAYSYLDLVVSGLFGTALIVLFRVAREHAPAPSRPGDPDRLARKPWIPVAVRAAGLPALATPRRPAVPSSRLGPPCRRRWTSRRSKGLTCGRSAEPCVAIPDANAVGKCKRYS